MGGTTAKASLIEDGRVSRSLEYEVGASLSSGSRLLRGGGELIRIPTIDIAEVGAGGGSIAWLDAADGLPRRATQCRRRFPARLCHGRGGVEPTVTDANVVLGYIPSGPLASGDLTISYALASEAVSRLGGRLGLGTVETARGIHELANAAMMRALRAVSTEKGRDPSDFVLLAYGGSGPLHAAALAVELGVRTVVVPPLAGLFSAAGLLFARAEFHDVRFCKVNARGQELGLLARLDAEMREALERALGAETVVEWQRLADVRYRGQNWSVTVEFPGELDRAALEQLVERFESEHERRYGTRLDPGSPVDIRALRLIALGPAREGFALPAPIGSPPRAAATRRVEFGELHGTIETEVRSRSSLGESSLAGPALIDEYDTTVVVPPGWSVRADRSTGALVLDHVARQVDASGSAPEAVARELVANALATAADEMATTIFRTAHSAIVRDAMDFSAALCGPGGETIAQAVTIPLQLGSIPNVMKTMFERFGGSFAPGDVYVVNDPFDGASHTPDVFVVKPSFEGETLLGFAVTIAHHGDLGGRVPGSCACDSTEVFEEGLRLPLIRLYAAGEPREEVFAIIRANVRIPHEMIGDLNAQVSACHIGDRNLRVLAGRYGPARLHALMADLLDHTERLLRREITSWPDGEASFTDYLDSDGIELADVAIRVKLTVAGGELSADFSDSDPQVRGALNCTPSFVEAAVYHSVMSASRLEIPSTSGVARVITVRTRPGTVTHVVMPGASSMRGITGYRVSDVMNGALAQLIPGRVAAAGEGGSTLAFFAGRREGEPFVYSELVVGTWGARPGADGEMTVSRTRARAWRTSRSRSPRATGRSWSSATAWSPIRAGPDASVAALRSNAPGARLLPTPLCTSDPTGRCNRPYGLAKGGRGRRLAHHSDPSRRSARAHAAHVRRGAPAR